MSKLWRWDGNWLIEDTDKPHGWEMVLYYTTNDDGLYGDQKDKALIAAAPEMLDALREALEYFDGKADAEYLPGRAAPVGNREMQLAGEIRAAIDKAEGRS